MNSTSENKTPNLKNTAHASIVKVNIKAVGIVGTSLRYDKA
jgi:hypothetical protein